MGNIEQIIMVILAFAMTLVVQVFVSRMRWSAGGLILPAILFLLSICVLIQNLQHIKAGIAVVDTLTAFMYFALYNIPTILFLCIYNYYQRMRIDGFR